MNMDLTPKTRRLVVGSIGLLGLGIVYGWIKGDIEPDHALILIPMILTGLFNLLKGDE